MKPKKFLSAPGESLPSALPVAYAPLDSSPVDLPSPEGFVLRVTDSTVIIYAGTERARFLARREIPRLSKDGPVRRGAYAYWPDFKVRGVIEGFYGAPWSMEERRELLGALSERGMNEYFYGPKDDPLHRDRWRTLYSGSDSGVLEELIKISAENRMDFRYMLAPGLDIRYSSAADRESLYAKYEQVYSFGVRRFGLLLDDLERAQLYEEDAAVYPDMTRAHIALVNDVFDRLKALDPQNTLITCPTQYWGDPRGDYISRFGRGLREGCEIFYTGPYICSHSLTPEFAEEFYASTGRKPLFWDNYPVNDAEMVNEFHIGPLLNRAPGLGARCDGLVANPMEFARSSLIPLCTVADYLWDSEGYDPKESFDRAVSELLGAEYVRPMNTLAEFCYRSCLCKCGSQYRYDKCTGQNPGFEAALAENRLEDWLEASKRELESLSGIGWLEKEAGRWLAACREFCAAALALARTGDKALLTKYLYRAEDVMKAEAERLLYEA